MNKRQNINITDNMTQESKTVALNDILAEIHSELRTWFLVLTILFVTIFAITIYKDTNTYLTYFFNDINKIEKSGTTSNTKTDSTTADKNNSTELENKQKVENRSIYKMSPTTDVCFGSFNPNTYKFNITAILILAIILLYISMTFINGKKRQNLNDETFQMKWFMILSTILLCIYIYMTGGFLDSPFSSALSIYLAGFLLMQDREDSKNANIIIIIVALFSVAFPYLVYGYINSDDKTFFFNYSTRDGLVILRLFITLTLVIYSLYSGQRISNKINKLYGIK